MHHRLRRTLLPWTALLLAAAPLSAQVGSLPIVEHHQPAPRWQGEAVTLGVNTVLGGVTAGLTRRARGGSFRQGFVAGAAGGALTYGGKRLAAERFFGAGLLGRQAAAVGGSVAYNAGQGRGALERVMLPVGPMRLYLSRGGAPVRAKLDVASTVATVVAALHSDSEFDAEQSLSSGALVFRRRAYAAQTGWEGAQMAGVVIVRHPPGDEPLERHDEDRIARTVAHERIHVLQYDQTFLLWSAPAEEWAMAGSGWSRAAHRYVDLGLNAPVWAGLNSVFPYDDRPWEREAYFLTRTGPDSDTGGAELQ